MLWHDSHDLGELRRGDRARRLCLRRLPAHRRYRPAFRPSWNRCRRFAANGGLVLGICNGFQILYESGLLPGALMRNRGLKYICKPVQIRCENPETPFTNQCVKGEVLTVPIGNMEGNYFCDADTLEQLKRQNRRSRNTRRTLRGVRPHLRWRS